MTAQPGAERLVDSLLPALGTPCERVLLVAPRDAALVDALRARGIVVEVVEPSAPTHALSELSASAEASWDAIVLLDGAGDDGSIAPPLARAHALLREKGRLVLGTPTDADASASGSAEMIVALSEAGFVVLPAKEHAGGGEPQWLVARRDDYVVREYRPGDELQILAIFEGSFFVKRSRERWQWEYQENPYGHLHISCAFAGDGQLVAHYAGYPVRFWRGGERLPLPALQIGDTMTLPAVRSVGRGPTSLLARTARHFYARYCEGRVAFNYGFNTGNIQRFSMSFVGARQLEDLPYHRLSLPASRLAVATGLRARLAGWRESHVETLDARWDELFTRVAPAYGMLIERDAAYLDWRYRRCPDAGYFIAACEHRGRLAGWAVFRRREERLQWVDALIDPAKPQAIARLLAFALAAPEHRGVNAVEAWISARPAWWRPFFAELGFVAEPEPNALGMVFVPFAVDPEEEMRRSLFYMMGDSDLA